MQVLLSYLLSKRTPWHPLRFYSLSFHDMTTISAAFDTIRLQKHCCVRTKLYQLGNFSTFFQSILSFLFCLDDCLYDNSLRRRSCCSAATIRYYGLHTAEKVSAFMDSFPSFPFFLLLIGLWPEIRRLSITIHTKALMKHWHDRWTRKGFDKWPWGLTNGWRTGHDSPLLWHKYFFFLVLV